MQVSEEERSVQDGVDTDSQVVLDVHTGGDQNQQRFGREEA